MQKDNQRPGPPAYGIKAVEAACDGALECRYSTMPFEVREARDGKPAGIVGYPIVFNKESVDLGGFREIVTADAVRRTIEDEDTVADFNHDSGQVLGRTSSGTLRLTIDDTGVRMENDVPDTTAGRDTFELVKRGDVAGGSFIFFTLPDGDEWHERDDGTLIRTLRNITIPSLGPVVNPAYPDTTFAARSLDAWQASRAVEPAVSVPFRRNLRRRSAMSRR